MVFRSSEIRNIVYSGFLSFELFEIGLAISKIREGRKTKKKKINLKVAKFCHLTFSISISLFGRMTKSPNILITNRPNSKRPKNQKLKSQRGENRKRRIKFRPTKIRTNH